jgi:hypothetical protein
MPTPPGQPVIECTIELLVVEPRVWRRLLLPGSVRLDRIHRMFQAAMGWEDSHLHMFEIGDARYGSHYDDYPEDELDEKEYTAVTAIGDAERFTYEYDFGDGWEHGVTVHGVRWIERGLKSGVCLAGANSCPPEDSGGPWGYQNLIAALADPSHAEHQELTEWFGGPIHPAEFDLALANSRLQAAR